MFRQGPRPVIVHGLLEYVPGGLLIVIPFLLGFDGARATAASVALGVILLVVAGSTKPATGSFIRFPARCIPASPPGAPWTARSSPNTR